MALQGARTEITMPVTGGAAGAVGANRIVVVDAANAGNVAVSTAAQKGFLGVTKEKTDALGYAAIRTDGIVQVVAGGAIAAGDYLASDANGAAVAIVPATSGAVKMVIGIALNSAASATFVDVELQPMLVLA